MNVLGNILGHCEIFIDLIELLLVLCTEWLTYLVITAFIPILVCYCGSTMGCTNVEVDTLDLFCYYFPALFLLNVFLDH